MHYGCRCCVVATGLLLSACGSSPFIDEPISQSRDSSHTSVVLTVEPYVTTAVPQPTNLLTLQQALALSLEHAPSLQVGRLQVQAMQSQAKYAGKPANPELEVEFENLAGSGDFAGTQSLETTISLAQSFPIGGDLQYMQRVAGHDAELAAWDQQAQRLDLLMQVTRQYIQAQTAQQTLLQTTQSLELVEQVYVMTQKRIDAGVSPQVELARASVELSQMKMLHQQAIRQRDAAMLQLALNWGQTQVTFEKVQDNLASLAPLPALPQLFEQVNDNPHLARWVTELRKRQAMEQLAKSQMLSDVTVKLGYRQSNETGDHALLAGFAIPLPIFDQNQGDRLASRLGTQSITYEKQQEKLRLLQDINVAYTRLAIFHHMASTLQHDALPKANEAFSLMRQAYQKGDVQYLDVIDAQKTLNSLQAQYLDALSEYHMAAAWIESMICQPLAALTDAASPTKP